MTKYLNFSVYIKQIATLVSGAFFSQLIMLLMMPVLTRIYAPAEFGEYSLFISITSIIGLVSCLKYDQAIMLSKSEKNSQSILFLSVLISIIICSIFFIIIIIFNKTFEKYLEINIYLIWLLPVGTFLIGMLQLFVSYSSRFQFYKLISISRVSVASSVTSIQIGSKVICKLDGLVVGKLLADFIGLSILVINHLSAKTIQLNQINFKRMLINAKRYSDFPKYQSVTVFLNALSQNMPVILLSLLYSPEVAGIYALTVRVLQAPIGLIGSSTKEVYYQTASRRYSKGKSILNLYLTTTAGLAKLFIIPFLVIFFFGKFFFIFIFGDEWFESGVMAQILVLWFAFGFINSAALVTYSILGIQKTQMFLEVFSLVLRTFSLYFGYIIYESYIASITAFMIVSVGINLFTLIYIYKKLKYQME